MLATHTNTGMDLFLPPVVHFHDVPIHSAATRLNASPALSFHQQTTAQQALDALRQMQAEGSNIYYLFVTDSHERLVGVVSLYQLLCAAPGARLFEFMDQRQVTLPHNATLEQQAHLMSESGLLALPVIDDKGRLIGAMDVSDLIRAMQQESTAEMYHLAGIKADETAERPSAASDSYRTSWLLGHLLIGLVIAALISGFQSTIASVALLVAFMPLAGKIGGQVGRQTLTFMIRSLSLGQINSDNTRHILNRELQSAFINGLAIGSLATLIGWVWQGQMMLGLVLGVAVLGSIILAALAGVLVPLICQALHIKPARLSALVVNAATDIFGFAAFLGLAALALHLGYL